jgi:Uma2 family endonuclease
MTAAQFFEWVQRPENAGRHFELERGEVVELSRPGELHGTICSNVDYVLGGYIRRRRRGHVLANDTGVLWERDPDTVRGPDIFFYDEKPRLIDLNPRYSDHVPVLVVEVASPNDKMSRVTRRVTQFLRWGVKVVWVVHPEEQTVTVYLPDRAPDVLELHEELSGGDVLPDFRCRVAEFFFTTGEEQTTT